MGKKLTVWLFLLAFSLILAPKIEARADVLVAGESAKLRLFQNVERPIGDIRVGKLRKYLERRDAPLSIYAGVFVNAADKYGTDWRLVAAISGVESNFGKRIPIGSYNAWGWANGEYRFSSWEEGIDHVNRVLKEKYVDKGLVTPYQIGPVYAPPSRTWSGNVSYFINQFELVEVPIWEQLALRGV